MSFFSLWVWHNWIFLKRTKYHVPAIYCPKADTFQGKPWPSPAVFVPTIRVFLRTTQGSFQPCLSQQNLMFTWRPRDISSGFFATKSSILSQKIMFSWPQPLVFLVKTYIQYRWQERNWKFNLNKCKVLQLTFILAGGLLETVLMSC